MPADQRSHQAIACGTYDDTFTRTDGRWHFTARRITLDLAGDLTHHLRRPENLPPRASSPHQG